MLIGIELARQPGGLGIARHSVLALAFVCACNKPWCSCQPAHRRYDPHTIPMILSRDTSHIRFRLLLAILVARHSERSAIESAQPLEIEAVVVVS
jgi:hypothetical protein